MQISINGQQRTVHQSTTLMELVQQLELNPRQVAIEVNRELVPRGEHAQHRLSEGDVLEIVTLAGGG